MTVTPLGFAVMGLELTLQFQLLRSGRVLQFPCFAGFLAIDSLTALLSWSGLYEPWYWTQIVVMTAAGCAVVEAILERVFYLRVFAHAAMESLKLTAASVTFGLFCSMFGLALAPHPGAPASLDRFVVSMEIALAGIAGLAILYCWARPSPAPVGAPMHLWLLGGFFGLLAIADSIPIRSTDDALYLAVHYSYLAGRGLLFGAWTLLFRFPVKA